MKIDETNGSHIRLLTVVKGASEGKTGTEFDSILRKTEERNLTQTESGEKSMSSAATPENIQFEDTSPIIKHAERLLNTLDEYRLKLKDTTIPLKEITPLIDRLERERSDLTPAIHQLSDGDSLKSILNKTIEFSSQEILRFKRGDYMKQ